jgi:hypothetical protein
MTIYIRRKIVILGLMSMLFSSQLSAAEITSYTGTLFGRPTKHLMPLGNGDGVMLVQSSGIGALSGNPPTLLNVSCSGMGVVDKDGQAKTDFYCNFKASDADSFDVKGVHDAINEKGEFLVIGGSGRWQGAKGKGKFLKVASEDNVNKTHFELEITK